MPPYLPKLRQLIKTARIKQAQEHLSILSRQPDNAKQEVIEMLALAPDKTALPLLAFLLGETTMDAQTRERLFQLTTDRAHLNFTFTNILLDNGDRAQLIHYSPLFKHVLSQETNEDLLNKIISTAGKLKLENLVDDIAEFIFYDHVTLKTDAITALKHIGNTKALERLEKVALTDKCDQNILNTIDILKTDLSDAHLSAKKPDIIQQQKTNSFESNLTLLASKKLEDRYQAMNYFSDQGAQVAEALAATITDLDDLDHDLIINLLDLTAKTIPRGAIDNLLTLIAQKKIDPQIRFAIYNALEAFPELESVAGIIKGISDPSMYVRIAAIKVLERHYSDYILAEIKNKIESGTKTGEMLVHSILDAGAVCLMEALMVSDTFFYIASNYIDKTCSIPVMESFIKILEKSKLKSTVKKYTRNRDQKTKIKKKVFVIISLSHSYLNVYTKLIDTCGHASLTFTDTQEAFESILVKKPAAIVCDLFFNNMTAMNFAREIREMYTPQEVPIIISSLQKELSKPELDTELKKAKIDLFCNFPATPGQIKSWIKAT
ncbi:MAG: HEAT repeat domain-containing protein [Desulfobacteraceae bacterium]|nr:HEAT repeat domain-containing protein [Desulfobacteraceae bacterium]